MYLLLLKKGMKYHIKHFGGPILSFAGFFSNYEHNPFLYIRIFQNCKNIANTSHGSGTKLMEVLRNLCHKDGPTSQKNTTFPTQN